MNLADIEADVWQKGSLNREHLFQFLRLLPNNDSDAVSEATKAWLTKMHQDPKYSNVVFPQGDIDRVLSDLDSYGRVTHETLLDAPPAPTIELGGDKNTAGVEL